MRQRIFWDCWWLPWSHLCEQLPQKSCVLKANKEDRCKNMRRSWEWPRHCLACHYKFFSLCNLTWKRDSYVATLCKVVTVAFCCFPPYTTFIASCASWLAFAFPFLLKKKIKRWIWLWAWKLTLNDTEKKNDAHLLLNWWVCMNAYYVQSLLA